ncbi:MAG: hypothetical protein H6828_15650 [Planctomycetes bacterium]|nr:hypothetical protein [Planctomycetota bacterium]
MPRPSALLVLAGLAACAGPAGTRVGVAVDAYPAGVQPVATAEWARGERDALRLRVGWNATDRGDFGEHDDEQGGGPGLGLEWRRFAARERRGWYWGARLDAWQLDVDWIDAPGQPGERRGDTRVLVLQPTAVGGYRWSLGDGAWQLDVGAGLGLEVNASTAGEGVGQGPIGLLGVALSRSF